MKNSDKPVLWISGLIKKISPYLYNNIRKYSEWICLFEWECCSVKKLHQWFWPSVTHFVQLTDFLGKIPITKHKKSCQF